MGDYQPHFDHDYSRGQVGENLVDTFLSALSGSRIETKTDYRVTETGNVYVETWQYNNPDESDKRQSGINVTTADFWCFASPDASGFITISTKALKELIHETNPREVRQPISSDKTNASIGRIIPVVDILKKLKLYKDAVE